MRENFHSCSSRVPSQSGCTSISFAIRASNSSRDMSVRSPCNCPNRSQCIHLPGTRAKDGQPPRAPPSNNQPPPVRRGASVRRAAANRSPAPPYGAALAVLGEAQIDRGRPSRKATSLRPAVECREMPTGRGVCPGQSTSVRNGPGTAGNAIYGGPVDARWAGCHPATLRSAKGHPGATFAPRRKRPRSADRLQPETRTRPSAGCCMPSLNGQFHPRVAHPSQRYRRRVPGRSTTTLPESVDVWSRADRLRDRKEIKGPQKLCGELSRLRPCWRQLIVQLL